MAGWRQAVALAMTGEEIETTDGSFAVEDRGGAPRGAGANAARLSPAAVPRRSNWPSGIDRGGGRQLLDHLAEHFLFRPQALASSHTFAAS